MSKYRLSLLAVILLALALRLYNLTYHSLWFDEGAMTNVIQAVSLIGLLVLIDYLIVLLMLPVAIPYLYYQWRLSKTRYQFRILSRHQTSVGPIFFNAFYEPTFGSRSKNIRVGSVL